MVPISMHLRSGTSLGGIDARSPERSESVHVIGVRFDVQVRRRHDGGTVGDVDQAERVTYLVSDSHCQGVVGEILVDQDLPGLRVEEPVRGLGGAAEVEREDGHVSLDPGRGLEPREGQPVPELDGSANALGLRDGSSFVDEEGQRTAGVETHSRSRALDG
jgi:hypothetical protein